MKLVNRHIEMTAKEFDAFCMENEALSDMDYAYNHETGEYDIPALEWDGCYGKHWSRYISEEARDEALRQYTVEVNAWVLEYRKRIVIERKAKAEAKKAKARYFNSLTSLGGNFPQLAELKKQMV